MSTPLLSHSVLLLALVAQAACSPSPAVSVSPSAEATADPAPAAAAGTEVQATASPTATTTTSPGATAGDLLEPGVQVRGVPRLVVDTPIHSFEPTWAGEKIEHEFLLRNAGEATLEITNVKAACGCTVANGYDERIEVGAEGRISITFDTANMRGGMRKTITVTTNDPRQQITVLTITGEVLPVVHVEPPKGLSWREDEVGPRTVQVINGTDQPMDLKPVAGIEGSAFSVELVEVEPGRVVDLVVTPVGPFTAGRSAAEFTFSTGLERQGKLSVGARLYRESAYRVVPGRIDLGPPLPASYRRTLRVVEGADDLQIVAECDLEGVGTEVEKAAGEIRVHLDFPPNYQLPTGREGTLTIRPKQPGAVPVEVPIASAISQATGSPGGMVGGPAPTGTVARLGGGKAGYTGTERGPFLLNFWASWCRHSREQVADLDALATSLGPQGLEVVHIAVDRFGPAERVAEVARALDLRGPVGTDPQWELASRYGVRFVPTALLIAPDGTVASVHTGVDAGVADALAEEVRVLLDGGDRFAFQGEESAQRRRQSAPLPCSAGEAPALCVESYDLFAGPCAPGEELHHDVYLRNGGSTALTLKTVETGADLSSQVVVPKAVAPGDVAAVGCRVNAPGTPGPFHRKLVLSTDDPLRPRISLRLWGDVVIPGGG